MMKKNTAVIAAPAPQSLQPVRGLRVKPAMTVMVIALLICACGFRPLYSNTNTLAGQDTVLDSIALQDKTGGSTGLALRNALIDRFYNNGYPANPLYILQIGIEELGRDIIIQKNDTTTRAQLILRATYHLLDRNTQQVIDAGAIRAVSSYNILPSQYTTVVTQSDARERTVRELADKITTRMAVVLEHLPETKKDLPEIQSMEQKKGNENE